MSSPATSYTPPVTRSDDEVLVRVEGVSKKFCRSLKKSLWYGVCDIASELNPFGRTAAYANSNQSLTTDGSDSHGYGTAGGNQRADSEEFLEGHSQAGLQMDSEKLSAIRSANAASGSLENSSSVLISEIGGEKMADGRDREGLRDGEFYAVKDVSFELRRGECLGLIGHNGAGKTTLLKMLNGLIKPDAGTITMRGRVGALIALGAGFNPILSGRENIYINGSVLGLTKKEIDEKIDEIIDFSEIREFIDAPVQTYSSGMTVRLGFAVATALDPDVLILDEVLAVGDGSFRHKCYQRIDSLRNRAAIIFVSHNMPDVGRICQSAVVMERGRTIFQGSALNGIARYN
jgi:ABC-type polysaccharide/polyol phosphate transport system ATPase subunit